MKIIEQSATLINNPQYETILKHIEACGRICYKSVTKEGSAEPFIKKIIERGHESVLEHYSFTFHLITDRAIANELVRHRIASYSQESTRYIKYKELEFIEPPFESKASYAQWYSICSKIEQTYEFLLKSCSPQLARSILPLSLKTELYMTANIREWRHIFNLRLAPAAHPQMVDLMTKCFNILVSDYPIFFNDITGGGL